MKYGSRVRVRRALGMAGVVAVAAGTVVVAISGTASAAPPGLLAPGRIYPEVNTTYPFAGTDAISSDSAVISVSGTNNTGCDPNSGNSYNFTNCPRVQMALTTSAAGLINLPGLTGVNLDGDPEFEVFTHSGGAVINQITDSLGGPSQVIHLNGTDAQLNDALADLEFIPATDYEEKESADGVLPKLDIVAVQNGGAETTNRTVYIKIEGSNAAPTLAAPLGPVDVPAGATFDFDDQLDIDDADQCSEFLCPAGPGDPDYDNDPSVTDQETDDQTLLVMWLTDDTTCGTFDPVGEGFMTDLGSGTNSSVHELLRSWTGLDLADAEQNVAATAIAAAVEAGLSPAALALDLSTQSSGSTTVWAGIGQIDDVKYSLSQIDYNAPADDASCTMNVVVSDLGNNGAPLSYVGSPEGPETPYPGHTVPDGPDPDTDPDPGDDVPYEVPNALSAATSVTFNVKDLHPDVTISQIAPGPLGDPAGPNKPSGFRISFSEPVEGFDASDLSLATSSASSPALGLFVPITASEYTVAVTASGDGTLTLTMPGTAYAVGHDGDAGYANDAPTYDDNEIEWDQTGPTVGVGVMPGQGDPTSDSPILFRVQIGENLTSAALDLDASDFNIGGTAGATTVVVTQPDLLDDTVFQAAVSGMTGDGTVTLQVKANSVFDTALNGNTISGTYGVGYTMPVVDNTPPTVTMNRGASQPASTSVSPIVYDVVFSEPVTGFAANDVDFSASSAGGTLVATVTPVSSTDYTVEVSGMTTSGDVIATVKPGAAQDAAANASEASTFTVNIVTWVQVVDNTPPTVTIDQAVAQGDPTNASPIDFTATFSEPVSGFDGSDISFTGSTTGGSLVATVTGGPSVYNVAVSGMGGSGNVTVSIAAGAAQDAATNMSVASTSTDPTVAYDVTAPTVTINEGGSQADPTSTSPITFDVVFSEAVTGFGAADVVLTSSTAGGTLVANVSGGPSAYTVTVSGMTTSGDVVATISASAASDNLGNASAASTSTDNVVAWVAPVVDNTPPGVTITQGAGQADPTSTSPIVFDVVFTENVTGFTTGDVTLGGTAGATTATVTGGPMNYTVSVSGMTQSGTVIATIDANVAQDGAGNPNTASGASDHTVTWNQPPVDNVAPTVTVNQAVAQADPTSSSPITFTVVFSEPVTGFASADVQLGGAAGATTATITGGPSTYTVEVTGMTQSGAVTAAVVAGAAQDAASNLSLASTSTDNSVQFNQPVGDNVPPTVTINQAVGQTDPTSAPTILFTVVFSEAVTGFQPNDIVLSGSASADTAVISGSGTTYTVTVSGMQQTGTVTAGVMAGAAFDASNNASLASTSVDNTVQFNQPVGDNVAPTVTINQAAGQADPTGSSPVVFTVVFSEPVAGFASNDITLGGTAGATTAQVSGSGTTYTVSVAGMSQTGTVTASIGAGVAFDAALNGNLASTSSDATVNYVYTVTINTPGGPVSVSATGGQLTTFTSTTPNPPVPQGFTAPYGALSFSATTTPGGFVTFTLTLPAPVVDYLKLAGNTWVTFTWDGTTGAQFNGNTVTVTIQDNGRGDSDPTSGVATDPGLPVTRQGGLPATGSSNEAPLQWATLFVLLGGALWLATRPRRVAPVRERRR